MLRAGSWESSLLTGLTFSYFIAVKGQQTDAVCNKDFLWMTNTKGQSPCLVAAFLQGLCFSSGSWMVSRLGAGQMYLPPTQNQANACQCNTVMYNMISACAACQSAPYVSYRAWVSSCPAQLIQNGSYPLALPDATTVPPWGFLDTSMSGSFNVGLARTLAGDSTNPNEPISKLSGGVIVAIVIGCFSGTASLFLMWYFYRRARHQHAAPLVASPFRLSGLFSSGRQSSSLYEPIQVERPPKSPFFFWMHRVTSKPAGNSFIIDRENSLPKPEQDRPEQGVHTGVFGNIHLAPLTPRRSPIPRTQSPPPGLTRDFTFVESIAGGSRMTSQDDQNNQTLPQPRTTQSPRQMDSSALLPPPSGPVPPQSQSLGSTNGQERFPPSSPSLDTLYPWDSVSNVDVDTSQTPEEIDTDPMSEAGLYGDAHHEAWGPSPPQHRSRLEPVPKTSPAMLYPLGVRPSGFMKPGEDR